MNFTDLLEFENIVKIKDLRKGDAFRKLKQREGSRTKFLKSYVVMTSWKSSGLPLQTGDGEIFLNPNEKVELL